MTIVGRLKARPGAIALRYGGETPPLFGWMAAAATAEWCSDRALSLYARVATPPAS